LVGYLIATTISGYSQGSIITNGISILPVNQIHVAQSPAAGDYSGFFLTQKSGDSFSFASFADEGVRVFIVSQGDPISLQPIVDLKYAELSSAAIPFEQAMPFYLGFYTGRDPWIIENGTSVYTGIYKDPVFGWGEFVNLNGTITMLDSGLEYGGGGIYAGTLNIIAVPEPATWALAAFGGMILFGKNRHFLSC